MRSELIDLMVEGEYKYDVTSAPLVATKTKGLWRGFEVIDIDPQETIHGNRVKVHFDWLQVGMTRRVVVEECAIYAHGKTVIVTAENFWEEMRKHI